jgi:excisionase family DNA binding protein
MDCEVGTKEAASLLGLQYGSAVKKLIAKRQLPARKEGRVWRIRMGDLQELQRAKVGRPHELDGYMRPEDHNDATIYQSNVKPYLRLADMTAAEFIRAMAIDESFFYRIEMGPSAGPKSRNPTAG